MALVPNTKAWTISGGQTEYANFDTVAKILQVKNGAKLILYADDGVTAGTTLSSVGSSPSISATAPALATSGTIATAVGISRVTPAAAVTGIIMTAGTTNGQVCHVLNEGAAASSIQFAAVGTSNVADGTNCVIDGFQNKTFIWDANAGTPAWYAYTDTVLGALNSVQSTASAAIANAGTIATAGVGVARLNPASAVTGIILGVGTVPGQMCLVINEAAAANSIVFNATPGTSNVADSVNESPIYGLQARLFVWDSVQSLWYAQSQLLNGTIATLPSATSPDPGANGTITTAGVGVALTTPAAARTGIILQAGVFNGQEVTVINQGAGANTLTMAVAGTSNVADGVSDVITGLTAAKYIWVVASSLWYRVKAS